MSSETIPRDYQSALDLLYERINYEKSSTVPYTAQHYRLDRMRELLAELGNPQVNYKIIHIAGTKGKGTTATLLYDALRANGMKVGLYTSPHLVHLEERFQVDGGQCAPDELVELARDVLVAAWRVENRSLGRPTFFELTTAIGLLYFAKRGVQCALLEVGLGGRLDSTNVCLPVLSIITSISYDHQAQLGQSLEEIANEKAGIIKAGVPVICSARAPKARQVVKGVASSKHAPLMMIGDDFEAVSWHPIGNPLQADEKDSANPVAQIEYSCQRDHSNLEYSAAPWGTPMLGRHQADNLAVVVAALDWLSSDPTGWAIDASLARAAIARSHPRARLQVVAHKPIQIIDTAHNPISIAAALDSLDDHLVGDRHLSIVFACSRDKDYRTMLEQILPRCRRLVCTNFLLNPRAVPFTTLQDVAFEIWNKGDPSEDRKPVIECVENPVAAWQHAKSVCPSDGIVMAIGSFFLAAELLA